MSIILNCFKNSDLDEFFEGERVFLFILQLDIRFFSYNQVVFSELLLVVVKLLFEHRNLTAGVFLSQFSKLALVLLLELRGLIIEILFLSLNDHMKLSFLTLDLFNQFFEMCYLLKVLYLLGCNFLVKDMLLLLMPDLVLEIYANSLI